MSTDSASMRNLEKRHPAAVTVSVAAACALCSFTAAWGQSHTADSAARGDAMRGWRIFNDKQCSDCHAIWDHGGRIGPDLGRIRSGRLSGSQLAGIMWNHIPKMVGRMKESGYPPVTLTTTEMADVFALIYFVRQLDELGDPRQGERILNAKGCAECHDLGLAAGGIGPDLAKWGSYANPVIWAQMMWEHAPTMEEAMHRSGMRWPELVGDDLVHLVAYIHSVGVSGDKIYLRPGSVDAGRRLFEDKKCNSCHPGSGPDLAVVDLPTSIAGLASGMWNHSPAMAQVMREQAVARQTISAQEATDILVYVLSLGNRDPEGDPSQGQRIFVDKGCAQCHESDDMLPGDTPSLAQLSRYAAPVNMAAAMWNHGETMLETMAEAGMSWPLLEDQDMVSLLAYLKSMEASDKKMQ